MLSNDATLFHRIAKGDEDAFAEVYESYTPSIRSHVKRIVRDPSPVRDITQEAFIQLWIKREQLPRIGKPSAWLYRVAANLAINYVRQTLAGSEMAGEMPTQHHYTELEKKVEVEELRGHLRTAVDLLPEKRRQAFVLYSEGELTYRQIAARLDISESTVRSQVAHSKLFLREYLLKHAKITLPLVLLFPV